MDKVFYLLFFSGWIFVFSPWLYWIYCTLRVRFFLCRRFLRFGDEGVLRGYGRIGTHLRKLIYGAEFQKIFPTVGRFYLVSGCIGGVFVALFGLIVPWKQAFLWGSFLATMPYVLLHLQLYEKRVKRSREGDVLVQELLNQYQICNYHMIEALERTALSLEEEPMGKRLFLQLAKDLQHAVTKNEVEDLLTDFRYAFDTVWGNVLASNIFFSHLYGVRVDSALKDLLYCMVQSRKAIEYSRRENHEARMMLVWLAPISFLMSIFFACRFFDFTLGKFFAYQLGTPLGLQWFFTMIFCYVVSLLIHGFLAKEKMDI